MFGFADFLINSFSSSQKIQLLFEKDYFFSFCLFLKFKSETLQIKFFFQSISGFVDKKNDSKKAKKETPGNLYDEDGEDSNSSYSNDNEIIMHMDIRETLRTLQ